MNAKRYGLMGVLLCSMAAQAAEMPAAHDHAAMAGTMAAQGMPPVQGWTRQPLLKIKMSGERRAQRMVMVVPQNIVVAGIDAWSNKLQDEGAHRQLPMELAGASLDQPATGGFHMLIAREEQGDSVRVASTVYYFGERGAQNPTAMFMQQKNELEIIPQPHPREHSRYRANEDWRFLVRFNGQPLANQKVILETSNGSRQELVTDAAGLLHFHVPDDFKPVEEKKEGAGHDHGMRRGADFVLATEHADNGKTYLSAFNSSYGPDAFDRRSLAMGLGFTLLGMAGAAPLLRQKKTGKQTEPATDKKEEV
ncbi:MAG: hypothetical protein Fur0040_00240 [Sideroxydans sp.]